MHACSPMDCGAVCPVCFSEYTSVGRHRVVSLQCGHLFGAECIEKWFGKSARACCPVCHAKSSRKQFRTIYASRIVASDTENEQQLVEMCAREESAKNEYIGINNNLRREIQCLQMEIMLLKQRVQDVPDFRVHRMRQREVRVDVDTRSSVLEYDGVNCLLLVACRSRGRAGILKLASRDLDITEFVDLGRDAVRNMVMSPFDDGVGAVSVGSILNLISMYDNAMAGWALPGQISSVCFDGAKRGVVYCGDDRGMLHRINTSAPEEPVKTSRVADTSIHSICKRDLSIFAATVHRTYKVLSDGSCADNPLEFEPGSICTNMAMHRGSVLLTFRDFEFRTRYFVFGAREAYFRAGTWQTQRQRDRIYRDHIYIVDDARCSLRVFGLHSLTVVYSYAFRERIVDFCVSEAYLFVLTEHSIHVFSA